MADYSEDPGAVVARSPTPDPICRCLGAMEKKRVLGTTTEWWCLRCGTVRWTPWRTDGV